MTPRQRLLTVLQGGIPDCVPVAPDFSNMIPARRTGKPFWDLYLYNDPPSWEAYIDCAKYFNIDSVMDGYSPLVFPEERTGPQKEQMIVFRSDERIVTQACWKDGGKLRWDRTVNVYYRADSPSSGVAPEKVGLSPIPAKWEPVEGRREVDYGPECLRRCKELLGEQGLIGVWLTTTCRLRNEEDVYDYYDDPEKYEALAEVYVDEVEKRFARIMALEVKPDFFCVGGSGSLILQTEQMLRRVALPAVKRGIELATAAGIMTHVHCCGPESRLVKMLAEETTLTVIDPLEIPPMGDCDLAELKRLYGNRLTLKGNLHTTDVMLRGRREDVVAAAKKALDDAADGGRFILSTGDQCGRDTPDENLFALVETARTYGRYLPDGRICREE